MICGRKKKRKTDRKLKVRQQEKTMKGLKNEKGCNKNQERQQSNSSKPRKKPRCARKLPKLES